MSQAVVCPSCLRSTRLTGEELTTEQGFCAACGSRFGLTRLGDGVHREALVPVTGGPPPSPSARVERLPGGLAARGTLRPLAGRTVAILPLMLAQVAVACATRTLVSVVGLLAITAAFALSSTPAWRRRLPRPQRLVREGDDLYLIGWRRRRLPPIERVEAATDKGYWYLELHAEGGKTFTFGRGLQLGPREVAWLRAEVDSLLPLAVPAANRRLLTHAGSIDH